MAKGLARYEQNYSKHPSRFLCPRACAFPGPVGLRKMRLSTANSIAQRQAGAHQKLDAEVFVAYGRPMTVNDEELLERLLALKHERADSSRK